MRFNQQRQHVSTIWLWTDDNRKKNNTYQTEVLSLRHCSGRFSLSSLLFSSMPFISPPDMQLSVGAFTFSPWNTHAHLHAFTHTKSLTPICTKRLILPDYGNRLSPMCWQEADFFYQSTKNPMNTEQDYSLSGDAPNCAPLLEKWTLLYRLFTCQVLDG